MKSSAIIFGILAIVAAAAAPLSAEAAMPGPTVSSNVAVNDLDLGTEAGQAELRKRIARAAAEVCGEASASDPAGRRAIRACRIAAANRAEAELASRVASGRLAAR